MIIIINKDYAMNQIEASRILEVWKKTLKDHGYRVTRPRLQVMEIIVFSNAPLTPQEIFQSTLELVDPPGIASVYRTLDMLDDLGLIQQIHQPGGCHRIWPTFEEHEHFLICKDCGHIRVIEGSDQMANYISAIEAQTGYQVVDHWLQFFGICEGCVE
jgi:Fur family ferric uptake transcriptional regulator